MGKRGTHASKKWMGKLEAMPPSDSHVSTMSERSLWRVWRRTALRRSGKESESRVATSTGRSSVGSRSSAPGGASACPAASASTTGGGNSRAMSARAKR